MQKMSRKCTFLGGAFFWVKKGQKRPKSNTRGGGLTPPKKASKPKNASKPHEKTPYKYQNEAKNPEPPPPRGLPSYPLARRSPHFFGKYTRIRRVGVGGAQLFWRFLHVKSTLNLKKK